MTRRDIISGTAALAVSAAIGGSPLNGFDLHLAKRRKVFPDKMVLDNPIAHPFNMNFVREVRIANETSLRDRDGSVKVLDFKADLAFHEALLIFRPYIRPLIGEVEDAKVSFKFDLDCFEVSAEKATLIRDVPIKRFLVRDMEDSALDAPLEELQKWPRGMWYFQALLWRPHENADTADYLKDHSISWNEEGTSDNTVVHGIFAPNGAVIQGWLKDVRCSKDAPVRVETGFIAAVYSSKKANS